MGTRHNRSWFGTAWGDPHSTPSPRPTDQFFDLSVDMLCLAGVDGYFKVLNEAWSDALGYRDGELLAQPFVDFVHSDDRQATIEASAKVAGGGKLVHFRNRYRCKNGSYKWLAWTATPASSDGTIYAAARDISDEVAAEANISEGSDEQRMRVLAVMEDDGIRPVFQPIVNLNSLTVSGYEALSLFDVESGSTPDQWFDAADAVGLGPQLEIHAIRKAISHAYQLPTEAFLSLNASPATLLSDEFADLVGGLHGESLVVEVTEHAAVSDYEPLQQAIDRLRTNGVRLAIDDAERVLRA
jgi:PAS domain S-box-containing protein